MSVYYMSNTTIDVADQSLNIYFMQASFYIYFQTLSQSTRVLSTLDYIW